MDSGTSSSRFGDSHGLSCMNRGYRQNGWDLVTLRANSVKVALSTAETLRLEHPVNRRIKIREEQGVVEEIVTKAARFIGCDLRPC